MKNTQTKVEDVLGKEVTSPEEIHKLNNFSAKTM